VLAVFVALPVTGRTGYYYWRAAYYCEGLLTTPQRLLRDAQLLAFQPLLRGLLQTRPLD
jgi:hypothetical protein